jgi:peptidoglycan/LPS O-acetylase OafA/YrhL
MKEPKDTMTFEDVDARAKELFAKDNAISHWSYIDEGDRSYWRTMAAEQPLPAVTKTEFLPRLESLRCVAALTVVGYHVGGQLSGGLAYSRFDDIAWRTIHALSNGLGAVVTFFVLSGFVLARSLDGNFDPVRFFRNRVFRLFPAAMAVVALFTALHWQFGLFVGYEASFDLLEVILNLLLVRSDINGVMWSVTVECAATPLILLSVWLFRKYGERPHWVLVAVLLALSSWGPYVHLLGGFTNLAPLYAFVVGVLLHFRGARITSLLSPRLAAFAGFSAIALFWFCGSRTQSALIILLECLSAATLIGLITWHPATSLFKPLDFALVRFYGRISYSFYLLHPLGILFAFRILAPLTLNARGLPLSITVIFMTLVSILFTTPLAYLSWRFIETPGIRRGKLFGKQPAVFAAG